VNRLILRELESIVTDDPGQVRVLDLGCGVGGSMIYLSERLDADYHGVTISGVQAELGRRFVSERGLQRVRIDEADLTDADYWQRLGDGRFDLALAVESFIHVPDLLSHLPLLAAQLKPGGRIVVVDDMISRLGARREPNAREKRWLREFRTGWYAHGLSAMEQLVAAAGDAGLALLEARDLTPHLELDRPRDLFARGFIAALRWSPVRPQWFNNLLGGNALQLALKNGLLGYYYLVLVRRPATQGSMSS